MVVAELMGDNNNSKPVLYSYWRSSAAWRVRIALSLKKIDYEYRAVNLVTGEQRNKEYKEKVHPGGLVPALALGDGTILTQSLAIIGYLDQIKPECPLLSNDPLLRAKTLELTFTIACDIHPLQNLRVLNTYKEEEKGERAKVVISEGLSTFESLVKKCCGKYCVGDDISLADIVLIPQVYNAKRWGVDMDKFENINRIVNELEALNAFKMADPSNQPDCPK